MNGNLVILPVCMSVHLTSILTINPEEVGMGARGGRRGEGGRSLVGSLSSAGSHSIGIHLWLYSVGCCVIKMKKGWNCKYT